MDYVELFIQKVELNEDFDNGIYGDNGSDGDAESDDTDSEYEIDGNISNIDDFEFDQNVDSTVEFGGVEGISSEPVGVNSWERNLDEPNLSDDTSLKDSDSDVEGGKWPVFRAATDMKEPHLILGLTFSSKEEFKEAVTNYAFNNGKDVKIVKNDKARLVVKYKHDGCCWTSENSRATSTVVAKRWSKEIAHHDDWKMEKFRQKVCKDEKFHISTHQTYRAMKKAKIQIRGNLDDNFKKIWSYCQEIIRTNPITICEVKLSDNVELCGGNKFLILYMCWDGYRQGFKFCRPILGVDGTHLKSGIGGLILTAVGLDANDSIFPVACAIVEDKQKGLIEAFEVVLPRVEHRFCVRHLHGNMKVAGFQGKALKDALWDCAKATTVPKYKTALGKLRQLDEDAYVWLSNKSPTE
ncbi:PREDICTED: uncharacterized protein LOC109191245 [Ipomoea nil]|uniref:uncharacterized protein LOC109191245 n=1 Tax=Ipomoea nil TaxID=35883 RepID=UPI0009017F94|nr:PREDICTED: uncharacterized protein LOC109191245 [Ipomoea nil]